MNKHCRRFWLVVAMAFPFLLADVHAQMGNTISGYVFGSSRQPLSDINVELLDDFSRSLGRTRTNASGRYIFSRIPSGRFRIRVQPFGTDYSEQEQDVEIQNIMREVGGAIVTTAMENAQRDFYLRPRVDPRTGRSEVVFTQEVPDDARELFRKGVAQLDGKNEAEGLKNIRMAIEAFPTYFEAIEKLGTEYIRLGHFEAAEILFTNAVEINPKSFKSWYGLSYSQNSQNKVKPALESIQKALLLNQGSIEAHFLDGVLQRRSGNFSNSEKQLKKALSLSKNGLAEVHWQLALLYGNNMKRYNDAADQLEAYIKKHSGIKDEDGIRKLITQFRAKALEQVK